MPKTKNGEFKWTIKSPCSDCPYRKDAPLGMWNSVEYENLLNQENAGFGASMFGCHKGLKTKTQQPCAGWLLDQRKRGVPSIPLRLKLMSNDEALKCFNEVSESGLELYSSIEEMARVNISYEKKHQLKPVEEDVDELESQKCVDWSDEGRRPSGRDQKKRNGQTDRTLLPRKGKSRGA